MSCRNHSCYVMLMYHVHAIDNTALVSSAVVQAQVTGADKGVPPTNCTGLCAHTRIPRWHAQCFLVPDW